LADDERRINSVCLAKIRRGHVIELEQHDANQEEQGKLEQNCNSAGYERGGGLPLVPCSQQALHNQLIGSVTGQSEESPTDQSRSKRVRFPKVGREIEDSQLARVLRQMMDRRPAPGHEMQNRKHPSQSSADVDRG